MITDDEKLITFLQKDVQEIKLCLHQCLRPFRGEVKYLKGQWHASEENLRATLRRLEEILLVIKKKHPETLDECIAVLVDPARPGKRKFIRDMKSKLEKLNNLNSSNKETDQ